MVSTITVTNITEKILNSKIYSFVEFEFKGRFIEVGGKKLLKPTRTATKVFFQPSADLPFEVNDIVEGDIIPFAYLYFRGFIPVLGNSLSTSFSALCEQAIEEEIEYRKYKTRKKPVTGRSDFPEYQMVKITSKNFSKVKSSLFAKGYFLHRVEDLKEQHLIL